MKSYTVAYIHGISRINVFPKYEDQEYVIEEITERKGFLKIFGPKVTTKIIHRGWSTYSKPLAEWSKEHHYIENDRVYMDPHADIHYTDGQRKSVFFKTVVELDKFVEELKSLGVYIVLE